MIDGSGSQILNYSDRVSYANRQTGLDSVNAIQQISDKGGAENTVVENSDAVIAVAEQGAVTSVINVKLNSVQRI